MAAREVKRDWKEDEYTSDEEGDHDDDLDVPLMLAISQSLSRVGSSSGNSSSSKYHMAKPDFAEVKAMPTVIRSIIAGYVCDPIFDAMKEEFMARVAAKRESELDPDLHGTITSAGQRFWTSKALANAWLRQFWLVNSDECRRRVADAIWELARGYHIHFERRSFINPNGNWTDAQYALFNNAWRHITMQQYRWSKYQWAR